MTKKNNIEGLLVDENFQNDVLNCNNPEVEGKNITKKYNISSNEFSKAKRIYTALSFRKKDDMPNDSIQYSLQDMKRKNLSRLFFSQKIKQNRDLRIFSVIAAVLLIPFMLASAYFYFGSHSFNKFSEGNMDILYSANIGVKTQVVLPDGTKVWLNSGTSLRCPNKFSEVSRNVELNGEAYFEVVKNKRVPMYVEAGGIRVKVYGTKFNIKSYAGEENIETTLVQGKISIFPDKSKKEYFMKAGQSCSYSINKKELKISEADDIEKYISWKDGILHFNNEKFSDVVKELNKWYDVDILLTDKSIGDYILHATFNNDNIENVLTVLSLSIPIKVEYLHRTELKDGSYSKRKIIIKYKDY